MLELDRIGGKGIIIRPGNGNGNRKLIGMEIMFIGMNYSVNPVVFYSKIRAKLKN